jgi:hypothetical protein
VEVVRLDESNLHAYNDYGPSSADAIHSAPMNVGRAKTENPELSTSSLSRRHTYIYQMQDTVSGCCIGPWWRLRLPKTTQPTFGNAQPMCLKQHADLHEPHRHGARDPHQHFVRSECHLFYVDFVSMMLPRDPKSASWSFNIGKAISLAGGPLTEPFPVTEILRTPQNHRRRNRNGSLVKAQWHI